MILFAYSLSVFLLATLPVVMWFVNTRLFLPATTESKWLERAADERVSVLIPARKRSGYDRVGDRPRFRESFDRV